MKAVGIILIVVAAALVWISGAALVAGAHYPARVKIKVSAVTDAISDVTLRHQKEKEYESIVDAASVVAGDLNNNLTFFGAGAVVVAVIQTICGVYLLIRNDRKTA